MSQDISTVEQTLIDFPIEREDPLRPPAEYARLREEEPVTQVRLPDGGSSWIVTRFEDVRRVLIDERFSADDTKPGFPVVSPQLRIVQAHIRKEHWPVEEHRRFMVRLDRPDHDTHRKVFTKHFTSRAMRNSQPTVQRTVDELMDDLMSQEQPVDFVANFARPVALRVMYEILGIPDEDRRALEPSLKDISLAAVSGGGMEAVKRGMDGVYAYFDRKVREEQTNPSDTMIGEFVRHNAEIGAIRHQDMVATCQGMLMDGYEVTSNMIPLGVLLFWRYPEQLAALLEDPELVPGAVNEMLRYMSISDSGVARIAVQDVELGGRLIKAGDGVLTLVAAANHDEAAFPGAAEFDVRRNPRNHIGFGYGVHQCLGQNLARIELETVFATLIKRLPGVRPAMPLDELPFRRGEPLYGVEELPIVW